MTKNAMPERSRTNWSKTARRVRIPIGFAFALFYFWMARPTWLSLALGAVLIFPGILVRALASGHIRKNEALATSGPYAYTRNPLYLGSLLMGTGFAVAALSLWVAFVLVAMFLAIYLPVIFDEEKFLCTTFPDFDEYAQQVPRMFPRFTPHRRNADEPASGFSMDLYLKHREYNAVLGAAAMLCALLAKMLVVRH